MLLSALTLAAMLQAAPVAPSVAVPEAPAIGRKGYLLQRQPHDPSQRVDQLRMPAPKGRNKMTPDEAREAGERQSRMRPPSMTRQWPKARPAKFLRNPVPCRKNGLERVGHPEALKGKRLGELPPAHVEYAISRTVDGCPVSVLVAQNGPVR